MDSSKFKGSVKKVGTRVTHTDQILRVEEVMEIGLELPASQQKAFEKDPAGLIKGLLTQEGHAFKDVIIRADPSKPISHLRSQWVHIVIDINTPENVCMWIYVT